MAIDTLHNQIYNHTSEDAHEIPDNSTHLVVTSPPYNVGLEYEQNQTATEYYQMLKKVWREMYRVLIPGGRICINVANTGRKPYIPLASLITQQMLNIGFLMRGEIIWHKGASAGASTAWGSWKSPSNPALRDTHEYILVFCKDSYAREKTDKIATMSEDEFTEYTKSVWTINTDSSKRKHHPAPFPVALPYRLIQLYSYLGDIIVDPFMGSGTTAVAAIEARRKYIGYETSKDYFDYSIRRLKSVSTPLYNVA